MSAPGQIALSALRGVNLEIGFPPDCREKVEVLRPVPIGKCKLCLRTADLQNSHLVPASLYKKSRIPGASNPNPTLVTEKGTKQTSRQIRNFVLCRDCEQLFSKNGENYVMTQVFDGNTKKFPLLDVLHATTPTWGGPEFVGYDLTVTPAVDRNRLAYFALSVFGGRQSTSRENEARNR